jgi:head-tail adaptor
MASSSVLWVEGKDDQHVVLSLLEHHQVPEVFKVIDRKGIENLLDALRVQLTQGSDVARIGIVVDADADVEARWAAIRNVLVRSGYHKVPERPEVGGTVLRETERPIFGAWLMPENTAPGMLEDFAAALVPEGDFLWAHAGEVIDGIPSKHRRFAEGHRAKAHIRTWLAWQEDPGAPMGLAITKRYLDADAPQARRFIDWLTRLMVDQEQEAEAV